MTEHAQRSPAQQYLAELPLDAGQRQTLGEQVDQQGGELADVHRALAQGTPTGAGSTDDPLGSVAA
ncbi:hypothetical protein, partial [Stutzerimonas nitrititolerans]|uniref:hypothetical protein n=1 Tax=Stutzerimonas nitrititolerans TaxID=2482751 RepID=UPI00289FB49E